MSMEEQKWTVWHPQVKGAIPAVDGDAVVRVRFADGTLRIGKAWEFAWNLPEASHLRIAAYEVLQNEPREPGITPSACDMEDFRKPGGGRDQMVADLIRTKQPVADSGLKDSGTRRDFETGAQRDAVVGKGRYDLMSWAPQKREAQIMEKGAIKYAARNWEKGTPLSVFMNSATNHLEKLKAGFEDEDHAAMARWNISQYIETEERIKRGLLPKELDDMPHTYRGQNPGF